MKCDVEDSVIFRLESLRHLVVPCADAVNVPRDVIENWRNVINHIGINTRGCMGLKDVVTMHKFCFPLNIAFQLVRLFFWMKINEPKFKHIMSFSRKHLTKSQVDSAYFMMVIELKGSAICIGNHTTFLVQSGSNLHKWVFQRVSKLLEPVARMKFGLFEKHRLHCRPNKLY